MFYRLLSIVCNSCNIVIRKQPISLLYIYIFPPLSLIPVNSARNLGVIFDATLSLADHISATTRTCRFHLFNIRKIRPSISFSATKLLVHTLIFTRLDYCNSLLLGLPSYAFTPLQQIQNASARIIFNLPLSSHTSPLLHQLHWLPVYYRCLFKFLTLVYKSLHGLAPPYLAALITYYVPSRPLRSQSLLSLSVPPSPCAQSRFRSFSLLAPLHWNKLPLHIKQSPTLRSFRSSLKTHLFTLAHPTVCPSP